MLLWPFMFLLNVNPISSEKSTGCIFLCPALNLSFEHSIILYTCIVCLHGSVDVRYFYKTFGSI